MSDAQNSGSDEREPSGSIDRFFAIAQTLQGAGVELDPGFADETEDLFEAGFSYMLVPRCGDDS